MNPFTENIVPSQSDYLHLANTETMTSSFLDKAAAGLITVQQPPSRDKSQLKWSSLACNLPLMKSDTFPSGVTP